MTPWIVPISTFKIRIDFSQSEISFPTSSLRQIIKKGNKLMKTPDSNTLIQLLGLIGVLPRWYLWDLS